MLRDINKFVKTKMFKVFIVILLYLIIDIFKSELGYIVVFFSNSLFNVISRFRDIYINIAYSSLAAIIFYFFIDYIPNQRTERKFYIQNLKQLRRIKEAIENIIIYLIVSKNIKQNDDNCEILEKVHHKLMNIYEKDPKVQNEAESYIKLSLGSSGKFDKIIPYFAYVPKKIKISSYKTKINLISTEISIIKRFSNRVLSYSKFEDLNYILSSIDSSLFKTIIKDIIERGEVWVGDFNDISMYLINNELGSFGREIDLLIRLNNIIERNEYMQEGSSTVSFIK